jgi:hypothetical protein
MRENIFISETMAQDFMHLFLNRRAYIRQSSRPHPVNGRFFYYRPRGNDKDGYRKIGLEEIRQHLGGENHRRALASINFPF